MAGEISPEEGEFEHAEEVAGELFEACSDAAVLLEVLDGAFDDVAAAVVQDAGQDLVALIDAGATTPGGSTGGPGVGGGFGDGTATAARIVGEFSYTAYGELLTAASHAPHPDPRLGHKGLFLDRLDTGVVDPLTGAEIARHVLGAKHTYFMVNRSYDPQLGRFLQRDPNGAGLNLLHQRSSHGDALTSRVQEFSLHNHIGNGVNVYAYVDDNPLTRSDPTGLWFSAGFQLATMAVDSYLSAEGTLEDARAGLRTVFSLDRLIESYAYDQLFDIERASDWDQADDAYSKAADLDARYGINSNFDMEPTFAGMAARKRAPGKPDRKSVGSRSRKQHGSAEHMRLIRKEANELIRKRKDLDLDPRTMRMHQKLTDPNGRVISDLKPDFFIWNRDGTKCYVVEARVSQSSTAASAKMEKYREILGIKLDPKIVP